MEQQDQMIKDSQAFNLPETGEEEDTEARMTALQEEMDKDGSKVDELLQSCNDFQKMQEEFEKQKIADK